MKAMEKSEWKACISSKALTLIATHPTPSSEQHATLVITLILQLHAMIIQNAYIMFNHEEQIVHKSLQSCTWVHFYQCLNGVNDHCNVSHMMGPLGSFTNIEKLAHSFLASNTVLAPSHWPWWGERHEHWTADALQFSEVEVLRLHDHQSIWECLICTTSVENPIASTPSGHGALPGEYRSQITHPALLTEQNTGGTASMLCLYTWQTINLAKATEQVSFMRDPPPFPPADCGPVNDLGRAGRLAEFYLQQ